MKHLKLTLAIILAAFVLLFAAMGNTGTAKADEQLNPIVVVEEGKTSFENRETYRHQFDVPEGYELVATLTGSWMEGHPNFGCTPLENEKSTHWACDQLQPNEEIKVSLNGQVIYQNADQNPLDDQWFTFGGVPATVQLGFNELVVEHSGRDGSYGSVDFSVTLTVEPTPPQEEEPTFSLAIEMGCYEAAYSGHADKEALLTITGTNIYGESISTSYNVSGQFGDVIDWADPMSTDPTVYSGSLVATLTYEGVVVASANASHNGACGEDTPVGATASCNAAWADREVLPVSGSQVTISAIGEDAAFMRLYNANNDMVEQAEGNNPSWTVDAMPSSVFVVKAVDADGDEHENLRDCVVTFEAQQDTPEKCTGTVWINFDWSKAPTSFRGDIVVIGDGVMEPVARWTVDSTNSWWQVWPERVVHFDEGRDGSWVEVVGLPADGSEAIKLINLNPPAGVEDGKFGWASCGMFHSLEVAFPGHLAELAPGMTTQEAINYLADAQGVEVPTATAETVVVETAATVTNTMVAENGTYTVQAGDTLWGIATANGLSIDEMVQANSELVTNPAVISIGWTLTVPGS